MADDRNDKTDMQRKRRGRNIAMLIALSALVVLFYVLTIVKMGGGR
ncbi:MAG: hypothetical protein RL477_433 [Pseudomonadota bacterium]|jgi:hypothetical protein